MPSITPSPSHPQKVLVTGASGFIAVWITKALLENGFTVLGTVRSSSKGDYLKALFKEFGDAFEYILVENIEVVSDLLHWS